jgi:hypothetical protein
MEQSINTCDYCGRQYKRISFLNKHKIPCKVLFVERAKRLSAKEPIFQCEEEAMFSLKQVNLILSEVILQNKKMQEEINDLKKFIFKTKIKINILDWLPLHVSPTYSFQSFLNNIIITSPFHVECLQENKILDILELVLNDTVKREKDNVFPLFCFNEKIYIYDTPILTQLQLIQSKSNENDAWREMTRLELIHFMNRIHKKIMNQIKEWRNTNELLIKTDEIYYNINHKLSLKIMDVDFNKDATLNKIRTFLSSVFKREVKSIVEYEFK